MTAILDPGSIIDPGLRGPAGLLARDGTVTTAILELDRVTR
jgi:hypothetical protein